VSRRRTFALIAISIAGLCRYQDEAFGDATLSPALELEMTPYFLSAQKIVVTAKTELDDARTVEIKLHPSGATTTVSLKSGRAEAEIPTGRLKSGEYELVAEARDANGGALARALLSFRKPDPPDWWTTKFGLEPVIPPPWFPVKADKSRVEILGRIYDFASHALPAQITTRGQQILSGPIEFVTFGKWSGTKRKLVKKAPEMAVYETTLASDSFTMKVQTQVEFDGFMYVDVNLSSVPRAKVPGKVESLDLVIPFRKEHAILLQNYVKASGPGTMAVKRFHGEIPAEGYKSPPMITTWIGTDHYGLEFSCESSRGWSMAKPDEAMEVARDGDRVLLKIRFISKPIALPPNQPRHIRFGLVATPTKTLLPFLQKARFQDDIDPSLLPAQWGDYPVWHPPLKNPALVEKNRKWIDDSHRAGAKALVNGGWNISVQDPQWESWGREMVAEPLQDVGFGDCKQYAACYRTPYREFMPNSFGYNAKTIGFDGIRFDTVVPTYQCQSLVHGCGWYDDDGNLWPTFQIFAQREIWKRLYRIFHGGVMPEGIVYTPNAAGPMMAVHSFADYREIEENLYQSAETLREAYPPDMVRTIMSHDAYGLRCEANLREGPLFFNEKLAALLVNGADGCLLDYRSWDPGYEAQAMPAVNIWEAWEWVDRFNAQWLGWWENANYLTIDRGNKMILGSMYVQQGEKILLVVTNYEVEPVDDLPVHLNLEKLGLAAPIYAEDAVTLEPVAISEDGGMRLDILKQRYRLLKISHQPPRFCEGALGPNLILHAPDVSDTTWWSTEIPLDANSVYVLSAQIKIDKPIGADSESPNFMDKSTPSVRHYLSMHLVDAPGVDGINGTGKKSLCPSEKDGEMIPYRDTPFYQQSYAPQMWEKTPGWSQIFLPVKTGPATRESKVMVSLEDKGQAQWRHVSLRKELTTGAAN